MEKREWLGLDQTRAFRERLTGREKVARAQLETACRESSDPAVKGAYEAWKFSQENVMALEEDRKNG